MRRPVSMNDRYGPGREEVVDFAPPLRAKQSLSGCNGCQSPGRLSESRKTGRVMKKLLIVAVALCGALVANSVGAGNGTPINTGSANTLTLAVYGDWPYSSLLLNAAPLLLDSINSDPKVRLVMHVGDIHSGSMLCTLQWNLQIYDVFQQFKDPLVYTPGDNEWTDCHRPAEGNQNPLTELANIRSLFFPTPGYTLGGRKKQVVSQAQVVDMFHPSDAQFVENVMWEESQVVFVTVNVPGSNNDTVPWSAPYNTPQFKAAQATEVTDRTAADIRWLERAFAQAEADGAVAVLIGLQANMWDPAAVPPPNTRDGLNAYKPIVQRLAELSVHFQRPVLLINGDTHIFQDDRPLANLDPNTPIGSINVNIYGIQNPVLNLRRITVQGSTNRPGEWVRLTIDPRSSEIFTVENVVYCEATNPVCFPQP